VTELHLEINNIYSLFIIIKLIFPKVNENRKN